MTSAAQPTGRHGTVRVLVAQAGVHGSTRSIAERIATRLREHGCETDALDVEAVSEPAGYDGYVVGSAIHNMAWLPPARRFVRTNADVLAHRKVWLFSVGMPAALRGPWKALVGKEEGHVIGDLIAEIDPLGHRLFSGVIGPEHLSRAGRAKFRAMGLRYGDYRDWGAVDHWAREIAARLHEPGLV
ncbi:flavodoxin domain-containing protein [Kitasatospora sp. NPDC059646]|uniref:flavodoxin domain-containing protein n=1 Tax=Kitasatospora sp. NPDC059646 TaxID=3346893 RepID=UPI003682A536